MKESIIHERIGLMYLSSNLKSQGHEVRLVLVERVGISWVMNLMNSYAPTVVGYSAMTGEHVGLLAINKILKEKYKFLAVFGGPHATFFPNLIKEDGCDAICIGEGDIAFPEFCRRVEYNEAYWEAPNFIVKHAGEIIRNPLLPLVENLDELPFPDRALMYEADPDLLAKGHKIFFSGRGCPYKCTYCFNRKYNEIYQGKGKVIRYRSEENLINEICLVKERYPLDIVLIHDDAFLLKPKDWLIRFANLYKERVKLPLSCNVRANLVSEEIIFILKEASLDSVWMGVECGNEEVANNILERGLTNKQIIMASRSIKNHGIKLCTENVLGLPMKNSYQIDIQTLNLNIAIHPDFAVASLLYPYPGTPIHSYAQTHGFLSRATPFFETNKRHSLFRFSKKERRKIENFQKLFSLITRLPFLKSLQDLLCRLPLGKLYSSIFYFWYGYNMKIRIYPFRSLRKEAGSYIRLWWKLIQKS
ncbi:MAG: radical SAM protein [Candidatus Omnitrophota bacterium]|nr:radical SAM protein [Candidatus Omnitrophota bacterium]